MEIKKKRIIIKIGDIFKIPIADNKHSYGQYYHEDKFGYIMRFFNIITSENLKPEEVVKFDLMFPPKHVGLKSAVRVGDWERIGNVPITDFVMPKFKYSHKRPDGSFTPWHIIEGDKMTLVGDELPEEYKHLEHYSAWSYYDIVKRIKNKGEIPYEAWK